MKTKHCEVCGKSFNACRKTNKYCSKTCRNIVRAKNARVKYHTFKKINTCNVCGEIIGKNKHSCNKCKSTMCIACGKIRPYMRGSRTRTLCLECYNKYRKYSEIEKVIKQLKSYEQMFSSQQQQIEDLLDNNSDLKRQLREHNAIRPAKVQYTNVSDFGVYRRIDK